MEADALLVLLDAEPGLDAGLDGLQLRQELVHDVLMACHQLQAVVETQGMTIEDEHWLRAGSRLLGVQLGTRWLDRGDAEFALKDKGFAGVRGFEAT